MLRPIDSYFDQVPEPDKNIMLFLRQYILDFDAKHIEEVLSYGMPFYRFKGKRICYLWLHKKWKMPYMGIVDGDRIHDEMLISENRTKMKILLIDPKEDIPLGKIGEILSILTA